MLLGTRNFVQEKFCHLLSVVKILLANFFYSFWSLSCINYYIDNVATFTTSGIMDP